MKRWSIHFSISICICSFSLDSLPSFQFEKFNKSITFRSSLNTLLFKFKTICNSFCSPFLFFFFEIFLFYCNRFECIYIYARTLDWMRLYYPGLLNFGVWSTGVEGMWAWWGLTFDGFLAIDLCFWNFLTCDLELFFKA